MVIITTAGAVTLIPPEVAPVCSGDELELTCIVPGRILEWTVSLMPLSEDMTFEYPLTSPDPDPLPSHTIKVNGSISLSFSRITPQNSRPLKSRLLISPATSVINGTVVVCEDGETRTNLSTRVYILNCKLYSNREDSFKIIVYQK
jgi:hypothetical protein